ncbi:MAG TPA: DUF3796 domain-containing protein [Clostridiales bacterium]|nr:DUF3796 domain-containing protein [Clostridiales bacterium]
MFKSRKTPRKYQRYVWLMGFMGFLGFGYFIDHSPNSLFLFSFFAFFSAYFTAKLAAEMPDERYEENRLKAKAAALFVPVIALFAIGFGLTMEWIRLTGAVIIAAAGWAATFITYAIAFWYYEKH